MRTIRFERVVMLNGVQENVLKKLRERGNALLSFYAREVCTLNALGNHKHLVVDDHY